MKTVKTKNVPLYTRHRWMSPKPVWFDLKGDDPSKIRLGVQVILDQERQVVVDEMLLVLALHQGMGPKKTKNPFIHAYIHICS